MMGALFDIISIGIPFCVFKLAAGFYYQQKWLILLGSIDLLINLVNFIILLVKKEKKFETCLFAFISRKILRGKKKPQSLWQDLGESCDVALSFVIVAFVIGSGDISHFPSDILKLWNWAVVLNVLGAGSARLAHSIKNLRPQ